jgi:hypothetical protein
MRSQVLLPGAEPKKLLVGANTGAALLPPTCQGCALIIDACNNANPKISFFYKHLIFNY